MADDGAKILIVGGSGFVSGTLARRAVAAGHRVQVVTRGQRPLPEGVTGLVADRRQPDALRHAVAAAGGDWDLVVDCIGYEPEHARQDLQAFAGRAAHLVFVSTDFVFDPLRRRFPQPAESEHYLMAGYGGGKRRCEEVLLSAGDGLPWTVVRPCHIYGPGSLLGCLPAHGRDPSLLDRLRAGEPLRLVGGGHFLQQPIFAADLAELMLAVLGRADLHRRIFCVAGPDIVESWQYYALIAERLAVELTIEELPVGAYRAEHPEHASFLCHRIYDLTPLAEAGLPVPATPLSDGLAAQIAALSEPTG